MVTRRIHVAKLLIKNITHGEIRESLGVGNTTISSVDRWLNNGFGGYRKTIEKYKKQKTKFKNKTNKQDFETVDPVSFKGLRKRYPAHFLLFNLFLDD